MRPIPSLAAALLLSACGGTGGESPAPEPVLAPGNSAAAPAPAPAASQAAQLKQTTLRWHLQASREGDALALLSLSGTPAIHLFCPAGTTQLQVNVPAFRPIGSEERLSFGSGGRVTALVADTRGDRRRGGVSGTGPVPAELAALIAGPLSASYGAQVSGPHPAPPSDLASAFVAACRAGTDAGPAPTQKPDGESPCTLQGSERLAVRPLRAIGTEPFWAARVTGRCVTYSNPENLDGTRIWTRYKAGPAGGGTWSGAYRGKAFELRIRPAPGCSDGMSDRRYPLAAELRVQGETRRGCAGPLDPVAP